MSTFISLLLFWKVRKIFCGNNYSQTFKKVGLRFRSIYIEKRISLMRIDWHLWHHFRLLAICMLYIYVYNEDYNEWKCELSPFYHVHMCVLCVYRHIDAVYQAYFKSARRQTHHVTLCWVPLKVDKEMLMKLFTALPAPQSCQKDR